MTRATHGNRGRRLSICEAWLENLSSKPAEGDNEWDTMGFVFVAVYFWKNANNGGGWLLKFYRYSRHLLVIPRARKHESVARVETIIEGVGPSRELIILFQISRACALSHENVLFRSRVELHFWRLKTFEEEIRTSKRRVRYVSYESFSRYVTFYRKIEVKP